jgi:hypothetical protein
MKNANLWKCVRNSRCWIRNETRARWLSTRIMIKNYVLTRLLLSCNVGEWEISRRIRHPRLWNLVEISAIHCLLFAMFLLQSRAQTRVSMGIVIWRWSVTQTFWSLCFLAKFAFGHVVVGWFCEFFLPSCVNFSPQNTLAANQKFQWSISISLREWAKSLHFSLFNLTYFGGFARLFV